MAKPKAIESVETKESNIEVVDEQVVQQPDMFKSHNDIMDTSGQQAEEPIEEEPIVPSQPDSQPKQDEPKPEDEVEEELISLSEEEISSDLEQRKTNYQKRIDKLVAERNSNRDEVDRLKKELEDIKQKVNASPKQEERVYTEQELTLAEAKAIEENDLKLLSDVYKERLKNTRRDAVAEYSKPSPDQEFKQKENKKWQLFVTAQQSKDPDFSFSNSSSAVMKYTKDFYQQNAEYYNQFGTSRFIQAAQDAIRHIEQLKRNKIINQETSRTKKALAKEKLKTSLDSGSSSQMKVAKVPSADKSPMEEFMEERMSLTRKLQGII